MSKQVSKAKKPTKQKAKNTKKTTKPKAKSTLTVKEQKFLQAYTANNGNATAAAAEVYDVKNRNSAGALASKIKQKPEIKELLQEEMARQGITIEKTIAPLAKGLEAKDFAGNDDIRTQLATHDRVIKLLGISGKPDQETTINLNFANFGGECIEGD